MKSLEIRQKFFNYFKKQNHTQVASSSLIPAQDATLLFANAGMNQFKDLFLGLEKRSYTRAVSIQKCIRAGGKHNDLENVGFTKRHLTFFEMMGNFSFGDYFKKEAIQFAWEFLTQEVKLNPELLYASVYKLDDEAYAIWRDIIGLPENRIVRLGEADNFWQMGDTGPCGPCTEIYIDRGQENSSCKSPDCAPGCSCDRFLEIWNLVFMQFNRQQDGTDLPLAQTGVDTGMGLERLCAVVQNKDTVYDTDLFAPIIAATENLTGLSYATATPDIQAAFRVLADHARSTTFAIADGCTPSNEGRGYVLRKIIRRAALFAQKLSTNNIFPEISQAVVAEFGQLYPELISAKSLIKQLLTSEIEKFSLNLINGQSILKKYFAENSAKTISGEQAFKLYDTYGFPLELTQVIAHENGFTVDTTGFEVAMKQQKLQSGKKALPGGTKQFTLPDALQTEFTGYTELITPTRITALILNGQIVTEVPEGEICWVVTEKSPLYVECGGQINDTALVTVGHRQTEVTDIKKINKAIAFSCIAPTQLEIDQPVTIEVNKQVRLATMKNHTATHLLQATLQMVLGTHIKQAGSVVTPDYLRFDFTHHAPLTLEEITRIEDIVNQKIWDNITLSITNTTYKAAVEKGVTAFFGEKYNPEDVRVVQIPGFSAELCGGTHVRATGDIGSFKITENSALSAGTRRMVALTGPKALELYQQDFNLVKNLSQEFKVPTAQLNHVIQAQKQELQNSLRALKNLKRELFASKIPAILQQDSKLLYAKLDATPLADLKEYAELLLTQKPGVALLESSLDGKTHIFLASNVAETEFDIKKATEWLKSQGIKGGGTTKHFQGTAETLPSDFIAQLRKQL